MNYRVDFINSIHDIDAETWQALWQTDYPFIQHSFLRALEDSGCTSADKGWQPHHLLVFDQQELIAAMPMYLKGHSYGEYVFDWGWADAYQRHGLNYYPKLINAIPFTPTTGPRLAVAEGADRQAVLALIAQTLDQHCVKQGISGWHSLFPEQELSDQLGSAGLQQRLGCQFHWHNRDYQSFDDFLSHFNSRKRKSLRKERRQVESAKVELRRLCGDQISAEDWDVFYQFYHTTYLKRSGNGGYLNRQFFEQLAQNCSHSLMMVKAVRSNKTIAAALCFYDSQNLYGRYWGCLEEIPGLHFEACYYQGIEFAIEQGLLRFDPGAQGEHKIQRGFEPTLTYSNHYILEPNFAAAIKDFLERERPNIVAYQQDSENYLPFKKSTQ